MDAGRGGLVGFIVAVAFLAFIAGAFAVILELPPSGTLRTAYRAGQAVVAQHTDYRDVLQTDHWQKARTEVRGVTLCGDAAFPGFTLYTSGDRAVAQLIAMDGRVVHEWSRPYSEVWNDSAAVRDPQRDEFIFWHKARLLPNGDLLALYEAAGDTPWGYGLVKLAPDSRVIWAYLQQAHHDIDVMPDGRILTLTHSISNERVDEFAELERPRVEDFLVVLSADGEELRRISLTRALLESRFRALLFTIPHFALADPLHANAVELVDPAYAGKLPVQAPEHVLLSFREPGAIALLDLESEEIVWATRGPWIGQHDPSLLENGNILLFDNLGNHQSGNAAQVVEFDPRTEGIAWRYAGTEEAPFASVIRSSAERLPNGNTLITESDGGRLFEVTSDGETVWEFVNPVRAGEGDAYIPVVQWGQRIDPATLDPGFRDRLGESGCDVEQTAATR
jgi:hypothetical protein